MNGREEKEKSKLTIRLAEPVVYLKDVDFSGKDRTHNELSPPSIVRGILVLHLSKPTKICSIDIELTAKSSTYHSEHSRHIEVPEEHQLYSSSTVYFHQEAGGHPSRRAISLGPTSSRTTIDEGDASSADFDIDREDSDDEIPYARRRGHDVPRGRRGVSVDHHNFHRDVVSHRHATTHIRSPESSAAILSAIQLTPPPDQGSPSQLSPSAAGCDQLPTRSGTSNDIPCPISGPSTGSAQQTPLQLNTSVPASPSFSLPHTPLSEASSWSDGFDDSASGRRRSKNMFSLSVISDAIMDSVRSHTPLITKWRDEETSTRSDTYDSEKGGESTRGRSKEKGKGKSLDLPHALTKVSEVFGLEPEEGNEFRGGWKEFKRGTYSYPIFFAIPADSPPSLVCAFGSVVWSLKATVHRPGKFTPRMETTRTINVVATPSEDATEDIEDVAVTQTWGDQMVYYLSIVGRAFPIGSKIPIQMTFMPLAKVKVYRVSVAIDEKVTRHTQIAGLTKRPSVTRQVLRSLKYPDGCHAPILPLAEEDPQKSPLYSLVHEDLEYTGQSEEERATQLASEWMGPGPWPLRMNVEIPGTCGSLHPTNMNKKASITIHHTLKIIIRVEKEGIGHGEHSRKEMYEIVVQYPLHLLSHFCNKKFTSLPPYSPTWAWDSVPMGQVSPSELEPSSIAHEVSAIELEHSTSEHATPTVHISRAASREREVLTHQFERLVAGQEAETGEAPPCYEAATSTVHLDIPHPPRV